MKRAHFNIHRVSFVKKVTTSFLVLTLVFAMSVESFALFNDGRGRENTTVVEQNQAMFDFIAAGDLDPQSFLEINIQNPEPICEQAQLIVRDCVTEYEKAKAIHDWVVDNIYFDFDLSAYYELPSGEKPAEFFWNTTEHFLNRRGVCEDYADIYRIMCRSVGLPCVQAGGRTSTYSDDVTRTIADFYESANWAHAWNLVYADGRWIILDCTWDSGNYYIEGEYINGTSDALYFDCSIEVNSQSRMMEEWFFDYLDFSCRLFEHGDINGTYCDITEYHGTVEHLEIPQTVNGVQFNAFYVGNDGNDTLYSIRFPEGMNEIFLYNCSKLEAAYIPVSTTHIYSNHRIRIYYEGTPEQWNAIDGSSNISLSNVYFNSTALITHDYVANTGSIQYPCQEGYVYYTCSYCGDEIQEWVNATADHSDTNGDGTCDICGYNPNGDSGEGERVSFLQKIIDFFNTIIAFFKNLF